MLFGGWQDKSANTFTYYAESNPQRPPPTSTRRLRRLDAGGLADRQLPGTEVRQDRRRRHVALLADDLGGFQRGGSSGGHHRA
ncbi:hypothetical protein GTV15_09845 [Streptomyces sp. SID7803]|nr:hypothetical protein [Streptomyces sp. SID7803]